MYQKPALCVTGAYVKIGYFCTNDDFLYHDEVHGDLFTRVRHKMQSLQTIHLKAAISHQVMQWAEIYSGPELALGEAILDALIPKDYALGIRVQISEYPDKLRIWSPG